MPRETRPFVFRKTYEMASMVEQGADFPNTYDELSWNDSEVLGCLIRFSKISILHHYIYAMIAGNFRFVYRHDSDLYEDEEIADVEKTLVAYGIDYLPFGSFDASIPLLTDDLDDPFYRWFRSQETRFESLWEKMTDEVFHLLFSNRSFLLQFNQTLAGYLKQGNVSLPAEFLDEKGVVKRQSYIPTWAKNAVFYRDHGRCVLCQRDLTGLVSPDRNVHYDHIVPLNLWGINDPCNLQLLCEDCNLKKSGFSAQTAFRYPP